MENSGISWTDHTFNPWLGCTKVSPACTNCYAERDMDHRFGKVKWGPNGTRVVTSEANWKKPLKWNRDAHKAILAHGQCVKTGDAADSYPRPPRVFCASLADIFEDWKGNLSQGKKSLMVCEKCDQWYKHGVACPQKNCHGRWRYGTMDDVRARLFNLIDDTPNLDWLLLTKRPKNIETMLPGMDLAEATDSSNPWYRSNVWMGTTVENQKYAEIRIPQLLRAKHTSPILFLSCEPMVGPIDLSPWIHELNWVIAGGESGPGARPADPDWFRSLRDQCAAAGVPFHFKQWGEYDQNCKRIGTKQSGRALDGITHNGLP